MIELFPTRTIAIDLFGLEIHWYGLMYLLAFLLAYVLLPRLQQYRGLSLSKDDVSHILSWGIAGVLLGGRLGYVLFYDPSYYVENLSEIIAVWHGGMSSHGGFLGVAILLFWVLRRKRIPVLAFADIAVVPIALGLACGRVGNFINLELYGTVTTLPWGIAIPGVEGLRHPTQLYAVAKDLFIAALCFWHLRSFGAARPGRTTAVFLMLYGVLRFLVEELRVSDAPYVDVFGAEMTRGQFLTVPVLFVGLLLSWVTRRRSA